MSGYEGDGGVTARQIMALEARVAHLERVLLAPLRKGAEPDAAAYETVGEVRIVPPE